MTKKSIKLTWLRITSDWPSVFYKNPELLKKKNLATGFTTDRHTNLTFCLVSQLASQVFDRPTDRQLVCLILTMI